MARRSTEAVAIKTPDFGAMLAERAYFKAEQRGFVPGHELEDWLAAEREVTGTDSKPKKRGKSGAAKK
ncbi:MAG TPA: DUF2934 domain-containing protein [Gammaproteobacteria bacterium]|nr:DUF2934 domain-containing protein [Gammaproteobacteria bacterium]